MIDEQLHCRPSDPVHADPHFLRHFYLLRGNRLGLTRSCSPCLPFLIGVLPHGRSLHHDLRECTPIMPNAHCSDEFQVPETKGLTLEEMDAVFGDSEGLGVADQQRQNEIASRIGLTAYFEGKRKGSPERFEDESKI